jgi:hypothetical protein
MEIPAIAPYYIGASWAGSKYRNTKWNDINMEYRFHSLSMLQALTGENPEPADIDLSPFYPMMDTTDFWTEDILGPLDISIVFDNFDPYGSLEQHIQSAYGYRGDHLIYWNTAGNDHASFIWAFAYKNQASAMKAYDLVRSIILDIEDISSRPAFILTNTDSFGDSNMHLSEYDCGEYKAVVIRNNSYVWWIENTGDNLQKIIDEIIHRPLAKLKGSKHCRVHNPFHSLRKKKALYSLIDRQDEKKK